MRTCIFSSIGAALFLLILPGYLPLGGGEAAGRDSKANLDLPFDAAGENAHEEKALETIVFYNQQFEGDGIFFCCDKSGTMKDGSKWRSLQQEVVKNIVGFSGAVQFAIVFFDAGVVKFPSSGWPADANPALKAAAISMVMSTQPGNGTCGKPAFITALAYANHSTARRRIIIYLSDGYNTCPGHDPARYSEEMLKEVAAHNHQRVQINTVCIGPYQTADEEFMQRLAAENGGRYTRLVD